MEFVPEIWLMNEMFPKEVPSLVLSCMDNSSIANIAFDRVLHAMAGVKLLNKLNIVW